MHRRIHYIDWLRVLAVLLLFPFHTSRVFNADDPFYVKSPHVSSVLNWFIGFVDLWHMPLLFFLAGAASCFALRKRTGGQYVVERVKRLLVPFLFGWLVLIPPQTWYGAQTNSGYQRSFLEYMTSGDFLVWNIRDGGDYYGGFGIGHLWFILLLFIISIVVLPLLLSGRSERGGKRLGRYAARLSKPMWWPLAALFIFIGEALPDPTQLGLFYYLAIFVLGFVVMFDERFQDAVEKYRVAALGTGLAGTAAWVSTWRLRESLPDPSWERAVLSLLAGLIVWLVIVGALGFGRRYLDRPSAALAYLAPASYPVYILHQTVIVVLAFYLVELPIGGVAQWLALFVAGVAGTFGLYEIIRRIPGLRLLFGIKPAAARELSQARRSP